MFSDKLARKRSGCVLSFAKKCLISPTESSRVDLLQNGLWGKIKTDLFRCGLD